MILYEDRAATVLYKVLKALGKKQKFLLPLNVCPIVPDTFIKANIAFTFIDINLKTLCMDESLILNQLKNDTSITGILFVKTFGINLNTDVLFKQIKSINNDIFIIDDMCPCVQQFNYDINHSYADMALFSSGYSKYIDIGYGGYGFLKDSRFKKVFEDRSDSKEFLEYKKDILHQIPLMQQHKDELNKIYKNNLPKKILLGDDFNTWRFSIMVNNKDIILKKIFEDKTLFASSHYPQIDYNYVDTPLVNSNTKKVHDKIINLFNDFRFTKEKAFKVLDIINKNF